MTSEFNARSFDRSRERLAPASLRGHWLDADASTLDLTEVTLVVAIKPHCDGCREFLNSDFDELRVPVIVIAAEDDETGDWRDARHPVFISKKALEELDVRSPPLYVLIDPIARRVVTEGVLFGAAQVAAEIAPFIDA